MNRILLLILMAIVLTACSNGNNSGGEESAEEKENEKATQESEETEESQGEEADASEIIDETISAWGDTASYEARQTFTINSGDSQNVVRTITTQSEQDEVKVEVDNGSKVISHYVIDGDHFTYEDGSINAEEEGMDMSGSTYGEIVKNLDSFKKGDASRTDEGYEIKLPVESSEDVSEFLTEEMLSTLDKADSVNGLVTVTLNDEYQYTGGKLTLTVENEDQEINMISNLEFSRIGDIDVIEKPKNM